MEKRAHIQHICPTCGGQIITNETNVSKLVHWPKTHQEGHMPRVKAMVATVSTMSTL